MHFEMEFEDKDSLLLQMTYGRGEEQYGLWTYTL